MKPKAWTLRVSLLCGKGAGVHPLVWRKTSLDRVTQQWKKRLGVFCWRPLVAVAVSPVLVLSSLWSSFRCLGWVSFWLPSLVSKERAATLQIGTVQRTGNLSGIPNGRGETAKWSLKVSSWPDPVHRDGSGPVAEKRLFFQSIVNNTFD